MTLDFGRYTLGVVAGAAMLAGCGAPQPPIGLPGAMPQSRALAPQAIGKDLMYVATETGWIYITTYPGGKEVGSTDLNPYFGPDGACADASGNVWIAGGDLVEYSHGGTKPVKMRDNGAAPFQGCSVDPRTGDLATVSRVEPKVLVWSERSNSAKVYREASATTLDYCGYDDRGNLLVDGVEDGAFRLLELPRAGHRLQRLTLDKKVSSPGEIQWDAAI